MNLAEIKKECKNLSKFKRTVSMSIGIIPSTSLATVEKAWEKLPTEHKTPWIGCYAGYLLTRREKMRRENLEYFVAYPAMPDWFPEIVEDFNNFFDNIKVEIVKTKDAYLTFEMVEYRNWTPKKGEHWANGLQIDISEKKGQKKICIPIVKFSYNKDYHDFARYYFPYNMSIFFRVLSYNEGYTNPFHKTRRKNKVQYIVDVNNDNKGYRSFSEKDITLKEVKLIDDIEKVNKFSKIVGDISIKQNDFILGLSGRINELKSSRLKDALRPKPKAVKTKRKNQTESLQERYPVLPYCRCQDCKNNRAAKKVARRAGIK